MDGFTGCYRGLVPKLCSYTVSTIASQKTAEYLQLDVVPDCFGDEEDETTKYISNTKVENVKKLLCFSLTDVRNVYESLQGI